VALRGGMERGRGGKKRWWDEKKMEGQDGRAGERRAVATTDSFPISASTSVYSAHIHFTP